MIRHRSSPGEIPGGQRRSSPKHWGQLREVTSGLKYSQKRSLLEISEPCGPQCSVNTEQASKCRCRNRPATITGKVAVTSRSERIAAGDPTGVVVAARMGEDSYETWETCENDLAGWHPAGQRPAREGCWRFSQAADEGVVASIPGNAGGAKALWSRTSDTKEQEP